MNSCDHGMGHLGGLLAKLAGGMDQGEDFILVLTEHVGMIFLFNVRFLLHVSIPT